MVVRAVVLVQASIVHGGDRHHRGVDQGGVRQGCVPAEARLLQRGDPGVHDRCGAREDGPVQQQPSGCARVVGQHRAQRVERFAEPLPPRHRGGRLAHEREYPFDDVPAQSLASAHMVVNDRGGDAESFAEIAQRPRRQAVALGEGDGGIDHLVGVESDVVKTALLGCAFPGSRHPCSSSRPLSPCGCFPSYVQATGGGGARLDQGRAMIPAM